MKFLVTFILIILPVFAFSQQDSASLKKKQKLYIISGTTAFYGLSVLAMNELWYKNYPRTSFHWIDDSHEWMQMDKTGHFFSTYVSSRAFSGGLKSAGMNSGKAVLYSTGIAILGVSTVELFDGFSAGWGASASDLTANAAGAGFFAAQYFTWGEEKILPKYSWHPSPFARLRPDVLGNSFPERLLKDYNAQTFWLSFNLRSLSGIESLPQWLCLSLGYGAEGMTGGYENPANLPYSRRYRQYYLSMDADLSKIITRSKTVNYILRRLNCIKLPFPTLVFTSMGTKFNAIYF